MPYIIEFQFKGLQMAAAHARITAAAFKILRDTLKQTEDATKALSTGTIFQNRQVAASFREIGSAARAASSSQRSGGGGGRGRGRSAFPSDDVYKPGTNRAGMYDPRDLAAGHRRIKQQELKDAKDLATANKASAAAAKNTLGAKLKDFAMTSRFRIGKNGIELLPLVGRFIGTLAKMGPEGLVAAAAIVVIVAEVIAMVKAVQAAMAYGKAFGQTFMAGGGTTGQTARLMGFGVAAGIDSSQLASMSHSYNAALQNNPYANAVAQRNGYGANYVGAFGDINDSGRMLKGLSHMLLNPNRGAARREAYGTPLEGVEWMYNASTGVKKQALNQMKFQQSPDELRQSADAQIRWNMALGSMQLILVKLGNILLPAVNFGLKVFAASIAPLEMLVDLTVKFIKIAIAPLALAFSSVMEWARSLVKYIHDHFHISLGGVNDDAMKNQTDAMKKHTESMNNHARALDNATHTYGGGPNAANAFPSAGRFSPVQTNVARHQIRYGQIPLG